MKEFKILFFFNYKTLKGLASSYPNELISSIIQTQQITLSLQTYLCFLDFP